MPELEDTAKIQSTSIFSNAYDDYDLETLNTPYAYQSVGVEADFNNMEPSTAVSPIPTTRVHFIHLKAQIIGDPKSAVQTRGMTKKNSREHAMISYIQKQRRTNHKDFQNCLFACFLSQHEPTKISQSLDDECWVEAMQEELLQFNIQNVWTLVDLPSGKKAKLSTATLPLVAFILAYTSSSQKFIPYFLNHMDNLEFCDKHNMVAYKSEGSEGTATAGTSANGEVELTATIDGQVKTITEAFLRRHLKLEDNGGVTTLPNSEIFEQLALMG
ncbi:hypothetical protein Tco_1574455, partial [Tanacetum coccineum]